MWGQPKINNENYKNKVDTYGTNVVIEETGFSFEDHIETNQDRKEQTQKQGENIQEEHQGEEVNLNQICECYLLDNGATCHITNN